MLQHPRTLRIEEGADTHRHVLCIVGRLQVDFNHVGTLHAA